jgi:ATP-dependent DNA helicase DinG
MNPTECINDIFASLAKQLPGYEERTQQIELAHAIEYTFRTKKVGVFEAGTGIGKSLAALIPAALTHKKVVISTNTIALQEQYLNKDIPTLQAVLPFKIEAVLLKGRGNYIGLRRWQEALIEHEVDHRLIDWVNSTESGDMSELDFVPRYELWQEINSDSDDCLRNKCSRFNDCFYFEVKRKVEKADILIVNHALLLADAASGGSILPAYDYLIIDEAHHLPEVATDAFSTSISNRSVRILASKALKKVMAPHALVREIEIISDQFFRQLSAIYPALKTRLFEPVSGAEDFADALTHLKHWLSQQEFEHLLDHEQAREKAKLKAKSLMTTIDNCLGGLNLLIEPDKDWVVWLSKKDQVGSRVEAVAAPLDVSHYLQDWLFNKPKLESTICMSATLATGGEDPFQFFKKSVGIEKNVMQERLLSPFNYSQQALLYLPQNLPEPNDERFTYLAAEEIARILDFSNGRAFLLFTSHTALLANYELLAQTLPYECRRQGEMPKQKLIEWFKSTPSAVLFGTSSFWQGVSIDGDQLSCVIIDRIPFQVPDDPIYEARCELLKQQPKSSWFNDLALPHATMRLKQGVGRLIRTSKDRGMVAILDRRMTSKQYGRRILECLPPMKIIRDLSGLESLDDCFSAAPSYAKS